MTRAAPAPMLAAKLAERTVMGESTGRWYTQLHWQILMGMVLGCAVGLPHNVLAEHGLLASSTARFRASAKRQWAR